MNKTEDDDSISFDAVDESIASDENLSNGATVHLGDEATAQGRMSQGAGRRNRFQPERFGMAR
jgi:hypothetical protein